MFDPNEDPSKRAAISYHIHVAAGRSEDAEAMNTRMTAKLGSELWAQLLAKTELDAAEEMLEDDLGEITAEVFRALKERPRTVWELQSHVHRTQPMIWRYLKALESRGLVEEVPKMWRIKKPVHA